MLLRRLRRHGLRHRGGRQEKRSSGEVLKKLLQLHGLEKKLAEAAVYDGVSGPCLGCGSTVHTGYTGGVMGVPWEIKPEKTLVATLRRVLEDVCLAAGYGGLRGCLHDVAQGRAASLPGLRDLGEEVGCPSLGPDSLREEEREALEKALQESLEYMAAKAGGGGWTVPPGSLSRLAEAVVVALLAKAAALYGLPCPPRIQAKVLSSSASSSPSINPSIMIRVEPAATRRESPTPLRVLDELPGQG